MRVKLFPSYIFVSRHHTYFLPFTFIAFARGLIIDAENDTYIFTMKWNVKEKKEKKNRGKKNRPCQDSNLESPDS